MGGLANEEVDVSAVGTLVWVRRPNGSWWPGRVVSPLDVPDGCPAPPRSPATPIMLLGRRDGPTFVDWCNLERTKRVKPFRCGDVHFQDSIRKAEQQAARRRTSSRRRDKGMLCTTGRYARKDDAILQALHIETNNRTNSRLGKNGVSTKSSPAAAAHINPPSPKRRKRKTPNDSDDDHVPRRRMRDLTDIGSKNNIPDAPTFSDLNYHLPSTSQVKRSKQSHHATAKRKTTILDQDQPCGISRKKDRSRPLSELCNGDMWNGFRSNAPRADQHFMDMGGCSGSSSATSSLDTLLDKSSSRCTGLFKTDQAKGNEISCMTGLLDDDFPHGDEPVDAPLAAGSIFEADHLHTYQPCASMKDPVWKCNKQAPDCSKASIFSQCDSRNSKKKTISSFDHEGSNRTRNALEREHRKARVVKYKAQRNEVVILEERMEKNSVNKTTAPDDNKDLAIIPNDLDCVDAVLQQRSESKREHEEASETISNHSNCENVSVSSLVFDLPPQHREPAVARCHALKPIKTLRLNSALYDVELSVQGCSSNKGRHVPLVSLMSRWNRRPVVGYPVSVEILDVVCCPPATSTDYQHPSTSSRLPKKDEAAVTQCARPSSHKGRAKLRNRRKTSEDEMDKSWRPHTKKPVPSPRKMRRLSSFATSQRGGEDRKSVVGKFSGPTVACIPLRVVFSRINEALSYPVK